MTLAKLVFWLHFAAGIREVPVSTKSG